MNSAAALCLPVHRGCLSFTSLCKGSTGVGCQPAGLELAAESHTPSGDALHSCAMASILPLTYSLRALKNHWEKRKVLSVGAIGRKIFCWENFLRCCNMTQGSAHFLRAFTSSQLPINPTVVNKASCLTLREQELFSNLKEPGLAVPHLGYWTCTWGICISLCWKCQRLFLVICILSVDLVFLIIPAIKYRKDHSILIQMKKEVHMLNHSLVGKREEFYSTLAKVGIY